MVICAGRNEFPLVPKAFDAAAIKQILVVGWGSQGPAHAQNTRDTLNAVGRPDSKVCVGLRPGSKNIPKAILVALVVQCIFAYLVEYFAANMMVSEKLTGTAEGERADGNLDVHEEQLRQCGYSYQMILAAARENHEIG